MSLDLISDYLLVRYMNNSRVCLLSHGFVFFIRRFFINMLIDRNLGCLWILCPMIHLFDNFFCD